MPPRLPLRRPLADLDRLLEGIALLEPGKQGIVEINRIDLDAEMVVVAYLFTNGVDDLQ